MDFMVNKTVHIFLLLHVRFCLFFSWSLCYFRVRISKIRKNSLSGAGKVLDIPDKLSSTALVLWHWKEFKYEYYLLLIIVCLSVVVSLWYSFGKLLVLLCADSITVLGCITFFLDGRLYNTKTETHFKKPHMTLNSVKESHSIQVTQYANQRHMEIWDKNIPSNSIPKSQF
jgi:hypothetical protein